MGTPSARAPARAGFGALDLAGTLALLALAAGVVAPALAHRSALRRDAQRLAELERVQEAIERYRRDMGAWPPAEAGADGWDASHDGRFVPELASRGYLDALAPDPLQGEDFHYVYRVYPRGTCACAGEDGFYVLGIRAFETGFYAARRPGGVACAHIGASLELAHVAGGGIDGE